MKAIRQTALVAKLNDIKGATFATLITETNARLKKTGNTFGDVRKVSRVNVTLGFQYEAAVNRQRTREGSEANFEAAPRQWGERIAGTFLVQHKDRTYLECKVERSISHVYLDSTGKELTDEQVAPFLPAKSSSRQDTEKEILVRDYALDSIRGISFKGDSFLIMQDNPSPIAAELLAV